MLLDLGSPDSEYNFSVDYPNGFYSARMRSMNYPSNTYTIPVLLAPQAASDHSAPVVDIPEMIRVPVYTTKNLKLSDYITERSNFSIAIDPDISVDTNGNSVTNDDFTQAGGSGVTYSSGILSFGPFDTIGNRTAILTVTDEFNNTTNLALNIEIYTPTPQITATTGSGWVSGKLDETLSLEPVDLFRVRSGTGILRLTNSSMITDVAGLFGNGSYFTAS